MKLIKSNSNPDWYETKSGLFLPKPRPIIKTSAIIIPLDHNYLSILQKANGSQSQS